jgi:hypothetical protein
MRVYHGTVEAYMASIEGEGLKPEPKHSYKAKQLFSGKVFNIEDGVYLTTNKKVAMAFAETKAIYLRTAPGELVVSYFFFWKDAKAESRIVDTPPVVLTVDLPHNLASQLVEDDEASDYAAYWCPCVIPPQFISKVEVIHDPN